jgi:hypothetical protein
MTETATKEEIDHKKKYETVVSSGQFALRALLTINGGATIAFLTFIGHLWDSKMLSPESVHLFDALRLFIWGTFFAVLACGTIFLANGASSYERHKVSDSLIVITVLSGFASLGFFMVASLGSVAAFQSVSKVLKH